MATIAQALDIARQHYREHRIEAAEQVFREILAVDPRQLETLHCLGIVLHDQNRFDAALENYDRALAIDPTRVKLHESRGITLQAMRRFSDAVAAFERALELAPRYSSARLNLGNALRAMGHPDRAASVYEETIRRNPNYADAHNNLGSLLKSQGRLPQALDCFREAIRCNPKYTTAYFNLGDTFNELKQTHEAVAAFRRLVKLAPRNPRAQFRLGEALFKSDNFEEAATHYQAGLKISPDDAVALNDLGLARQRLNQHDEAVDCFRRAIGVDSNIAELHNNLGISLRAIELPDEAVASFRTALQLKPDYSNPHYNLGNYFRDAGDYVRAEAEYDRSIELDPQYARPHFHRSFVWLARGDFARGWPEYEWRWKLDEMQSMLRHSSHPRWDGSPLDGKTITLYAEQGLGDTLQFVRYASLVQRAGGRVVVECQPPLERLLRTCPGIDELVARGNPLPSMDFQCPLMSLPYLFKTELTSIPASIPYLFAEAPLVDRWRDRLSAFSGFRIGISWQGSPTYRSDKSRSFALKHFAALTDLPGLRLFSLQKGIGAEQLGDCGEDLGIVDLAAELDIGPDAFIDTAAAMMSLDLVITSDTAIAHLAGALGVPVWIALNYSPEWRHLLDREDSPWYPTVRLFRQKNNGDWAEVFQRIRLALNDRIRNDGP